MSETIKTIAVLGGTGQVGYGLALRWALNGYEVIVGSRTEEKATAAADEMKAAYPEAQVKGMHNEAAAEACDLVVLSVPYSAHQSTLETVKPFLSGKILIDLTVPLVPPKVSTVQLPEGQAATLEAQAFLGEDVQVVAAFQNVGAVKLKDPNNEIECDVFVCSNSKAARETVSTLVEAAGLRPIDAGALANAIAAESLTALLIHINKTYKVPGAGIRITGIGKD
ncbi:NADPH-dependent F420 reductase [Anaerolineales bacterium]